MPSISSRGDSSWSSHALLPPSTGEWERALVEPVLARVFEEPGPLTADKKEVGDAEAAR
jgi:hypothetical protein